MALREYNVWSDWDRELDTMRAYNADEVDELFGRIREAWGAVAAAWTARGGNDGRVYQEELDRTRAELDSLLLPGPGRWGAPTEVIHLCPPFGSDALPCCGRSARLAMPGTRITLNPSWVTCPGPAAPPNDCGGEHPEDGCGCRYCREGPL